MCDGTRRNEGGVMLLGGVRLGAGTRGREGEVMVLGVGKVG